MADTGDTSDASDKKSLHSFTLKPRNTNYALLVIKQQHLAHSL